jgi:hypothetical protein
MKSGFKGSRGDPQLKTPHGLSARDMPSSKPSKCAFQKNFGWENDIQTCQERVKVVKNNTFVRKHEFHSIKLNHILGETAVKAYVDITLDDCFIIHGLRLIRHSKGVLLAMPQTKRRGRICSMQELAPCAFAG